MFISLSGVIGTDYHISLYKENRFDTYDFSTGKFYLFVDYNFMRTPSGYPALSVQQMTHLGGGNYQTFVNSSGWKNEDYEVYFHAKSGEYLVVAGGDIPLTSNNNQNYNFSVYI